MLKMFLVIALAYADMQNAILHTIEESVLSHTYVQDAEYMCDLLTSRLAYYGVDLDNKNDCLDVQISSTYGNTIQQLYDKFKETDSNVLKTEHFKVRKKRRECVVYCPIETLLGTYIEKWVYKQIPEINLNSCFQIRQIDCEPMTNITLGDFQLQPFDECYNCLDEYDDMANEYNSFYVEFKQLKANLNREIVLVWRFQMPNILAKKVKTPIIKF